jgi:hypothetical protein
MKSRFSWVVGSRMESQSHDTEQRRSNYTSNRTFSWLPSFIRLYAAPGCGCLAQLVKEINRQKQMRRAHLADTEIEGLTQMNRGGSPFFGIRTHHVVIALIAILIAVALVSNYYLW